jgi:hypothetical protein
MLSVTKSGKPKHENTEDFSVSSIPRLVTVPMIRMSSIRAVGFSFDYVFLYLSDFVPIYTLFNKHLLIITLCVEWCARS